MVRRVFFSFHYGRDAWRASQVRNSWVPKKNADAAGYVDAAEWEEVKQEGEQAIKDWIDNQLHGTSVTAVLIGNDTADRKYVKYEIEQSIRRGNGLVGIKIHNLKNRNRETDFAGSNPLDDFVIETTSGETQLSKVFETYDWVRDDGRNNLGKWVEEAKLEADQLPDSTRQSVKERESQGIGINWNTVAGAAAVGAVLLWAKNRSDNSKQSQMTSYSLTDESDSNQFGTSYW